MFGSKKAIVGIDIGASAIKLAQLKQSKSGYILKALDLEPLPPEAVVDSSIMDSSAVVQAIKDLIVRNKLGKNADVTIAVSGHSVIIRKISLPLMTDEELGGSIQWEAEQYIPFDIADVYLDFQIIGPDPVDQGQMEVILVAARREFINEYTGVIRESGLVPVIVDVESFAVENIYCSLYSEELLDVVALIDIGASVAQLNILKNSVSVFTREIQMGGAAYNEELQKHFGLSNDDAEMLKLSGSFDGVDSDEAHTVIDQVSDNLVQEIVRALDFFSATFNDEKVSKVYLTGGVCLTSGLMDKCEHSLDMPVALLDPFSRISVKESAFDLEFVKASAPFYAVAAGLATRTFGDKL
ncbi:MAG: type IV pilus assembly protein PilM [Desulfuromonadaceae bacterium]|nr:type IV pilus assembly protein PilM [Desulfuromonadaceae bacterium]